MKAFLSCFLFFYSINVFAIITDDLQYMETGSGYYSEIVGTGIEAGFYAKVIIHQTDKDVELWPSVTSVRSENTAGCRLDKILLKEKILIGSNLYAYAYNVFIGTSVNADTGSCLVMIQDGKGETVKMVAYSYITDDL